MLALHLALTSLLLGTGLSVSSTSSTPTSSSSSRAPLTSSYTTSSTVNVTSAVSYSPATTSTLLHTVKATSAVPHSSATSTLFHTVKATSAVPHSSATNCPKLPQLNHGNVSMSNNTFIRSEGLFSCEEGYDLVGNDTTECLPSGNWSVPMPKCVPVDCGNWTFPGYNNNVTYTNGTQLGSIAFRYCVSGYFFSPGVKSKSAKCLSSGNWSLAAPECVGVVCEYITLNRSVGIIPNYTASYPMVNSTVDFSCNDTEHTLVGYSIIRCTDTGEWTGPPPTCKNIEDGAPCTRNTDSRRTIWNEADRGAIVNIPCLKGFAGSISRQCGENGVWKLPFYNCIRKEIDDIDKQISAILDHPSEEVVTDALGKLKGITNTSSTKDDIYSGEIVKVTSILENIATASSKIQVTDEQTVDFVGTTSNLLDTSNTNSWHAISQDSEDETNTDKPDAKGAAKVLDVVGKYSDVVVGTLKKGSEKNKTVPAQNLVLHVRKLEDSKDGVSFPGTKEKEKYKLTSSFHIPNSALKGLQNMSSVVYKNLRGILSSKIKSNSTATHAINSEVLAVKIPNWETNKKRFNLTLTFRHFKGKYLSPQCSFWNDTLAKWDGAGCVLNETESTADKTVCECNHLTNFAILMSPWIQENVDTKAIDIISTVGCSISLIALVATIVMHIVLWRYVKSDRVILLMNLSVALILSYGIFIGGVDRTEDKDACTVVAVLLQYIYLVVFFLMLAEGIEIAITVLYVFATASRIKWLLPCAWLIPAVIVGISLGATQLEGYGNEQFCWLSVEGGLIWAFVAPALLIILVNFVLIILVMGAAFRTATLAQKSSTERTKAGVKCLCVLLPIMGCTWVIGIFYVNESAAWIQYVFSVCNGLQGLVIFIFHCALNQQIHKAIKTRRHKYINSMLSTASTGSKVVLPRVKTRSSSALSIYDTSSQDNVHLRQYRNKTSFRSNHYRDSGTS